MNKPLAALALLILFPAVAFATTRTVTNLNDAGPGSLREAAVDLPVNGDTVVFDATLSHSTITLASELLVTKNITISTTLRIQISGNKASRVLHVAAGASVTVSGLNLREGSSTGGGGCIYNQGTLTLISSTVEECVAAQGGGGVRNEAVLHLGGTTISGNTASGSFGGGIDNVFGATLTMVDSTVSGNFASGDGGGIDNFAAGSTVSLVSSTVAYNRAGGTGGGIHSAAANANSVTLQQSILANNAAAASPDCSGTLVSADYNLVTSLAACTLSGTTTHNIVGQDPLLSALQVHGTAPRTHALRPGSPAMDAIPEGSCAQTFDSRLLVRPLDGDANGTASCDIGAYEASTPIVVNSLLDPSDPGKCTLRDAVNSANMQTPTEGCAAGVVSPVGNRIVFAVTGRINLNGAALVANPAVHIDGPGADRLTVSAERQNRAFTFQESGDPHGYALSGLTVANGAGGPGGAVNFLGLGQATLAIDRVAFEDNAITASEGGALYLYNLLSGQTGVEIDNSSFSNTLGRSAGPYILAVESSVRISNTTIGETRSPIAIEARTTTPGALARVRLIDSTLVGSEPVGANARAEGGATAGSASIEYRNSIIAGHGVELTTTGTGVLQSGGYNVIDDNSGPAAATGDLKNTDPKVALHLYGGGPTRTIAPLPGSPAIDHVPPEQCVVFVDQRGVLRPLDGDRSGGALCDAGAFETAPPIVVDSLLDTADPGKCRLRDAIDAANTNTAVEGCPAGLATAPDLISFGVNGTIALGSPLVPTGSVAIRGPGAGKLKIDGQGATTAFVFGSVAGSDYTVTGLSVENGSSGTTGGVLASGSNTFSLAEALLRNNTQYSFAAVSAGPVQILRSTITVDPATDYQFLVQIKDGTAVIEGSTANDHSKLASTAGILVQDSGGAPTYVMVKGTTLNGSGSNGLWLFDTGTVAIVANSIFSNHSFQDISQAAGSSLISWGYNLSSKGGLSGTGDQINTDPLLGPLVTNFGEMPVFEPMPGSPALLSVPETNCGQPFDERGIERPLFLDCSIGAAEPLGRIFADGFESP